MFTIFALITFAGAAWASFEFSKVVTEEWQSKMTPWRDIAASLGFAAVAGCGIVTAAHDLVTIWIR